MSMRRWVGQRSDVPIVGGDHMLTAQNISFDVQGQIERRPGLTYFASNGATSMASFTAQLSGSFIIFAGDGVVSVEVMA